MDRASQISAIEDEVTGGQHPFLPDHTDRNYLQRVARDLGGSFCLAQRVRHPLPMCLRPAGHRGRHQGGGALWR